MTQSSLERLQQWFAERCDGEWEHQRGIQIGTLDNPGWSIRVSLVGTPLENRSLAKQMDERSDEDWVFYSVEDGRFEAAGGAENLVEMVEFFLNWAKDEGEVDASPSDDS